MFSVSPSFAPRLRYATTRSMPKSPLPQRPQPLPLTSSRSQPHLNLRVISKSPRLSGNSSQLVDSARSFFPLWFSLLPPTSRGPISAVYSVDRQKPERPKSHSLRTPRLPPLLRSALNSRHLPFSVSSPYERRRPSARVLPVEPGSHPGDTPNPNHPNPFPEIGFVPSKTAWRENRTIVWNFFTPARN